MDLVKTGKVDMIINTPLGRESFCDEKSIRRAAIRYNVPCITTLSAAIAADARDSCDDRKFRLRCTPCNRCM